MPPNHQKITVDCPICESNAIFRCASRSPKQHPVGLGELIPERKFQLLKRGAKKSTNRAPPTLFSVNLLCYGLGALSKKRLRRNN